MTTSDGSTATKQASRSRKRATAEAPPPDQEAGGQQRTKARSAKKQALLQVGTDPAKQIIKWLEKCTAVGRRPDDVFSDWLKLVNACLDMEAQHLRALATTGRPAEDPPEIAALWAEMRTRYPTPTGAKESYFDYFSHAFTILYATARDDLQDVMHDVVGEVYMAFGYPHSGLGQYFTPMSVARAMAMMMIPDGRGEVHQRLKDAIAKSPAAQAALLAGQGLEGEVAQAWLIGRVIPAAIEHYTPVTVADPAGCGSGVLLLAAASQFDSWMTQLGLVQLFGIDVDDMCVQMCRVNLKLYGLNGHGMEEVLRRAEAVLIQHGVADWVPPAELQTDSAPADDQGGDEPLVQQVLAFPDVNQQKAA